MGTSQTIGTRIILTGPAGHTLTFTQTQGFSMTGDDYQIRRLDGSVIYGGGGLTTWTSTGNLIGTPADGTWRIEIIPIGGYHSDARANGGADSIQLKIGGKGINFGTSAANTFTLLQYWNWRITPAGKEWNEPSTALQLTDTLSPINQATIDKQCDGSDLRNVVVDSECPSDFYFFKTTAASTVPLGTTAQATIACPATATLNGVWKRGASQVGNTFTQFISVPGAVAPIVGDLSSNPLATTSTLVDSGAGASGSVSTTITYNNAAGATYQLIVQAGSTGTRQVSNPVYLEPRQCVFTIPSIIALSHDEDSWQVSASQAQCNGDPVSIEITAYLLGAGSGINAASLTIYDAQTGIPRLQIPTSAMHGEGGFPNFVYSISVLLPPGPWVAIATADLTGGIGVKDFFDATSFNVPQGTCKDVDVAIGPVLFAINNTNNTVNRLGTNLTSYIDHINAHLHILNANLTATRTDILQAINDLNITITGNFTFTDENVTAILAILLDKLGPVGEPVEIHVQSFWELFGPILLCLACMALIGRVGPWFLPFSAVAGMAVLVMAFTQPYVVLVIVQAALGGFLASFSLWTLALVVMAEKNPKKWWTI